MDLCCIAVLEPVEGRRSPAVVALETDLARADRPRRGGGSTATGSLPRQHAVPEALARLRAARAGRASRPRSRTSRTCDCRRSPTAPPAGSRSPPCCAGAGACSAPAPLRAWRRRWCAWLPRSRRSLDQPIDGAAAPVVAGADEVPAAVADDAFAGKLLKPLPVERLGPAAEHDREIVGQICGLGLAALLEPQLANALGISGKNDIGIASADAAAPFGGGLPEAV